MDHVYKGQLQTYALKQNLELPVYATEREGPHHAPRFRCKVTFAGQTFESQEFFPTLKSAEHAAAKVALASLALLTQEGVDVAYKNLLQEIAQNVKSPLPSYETTTSGPSHAPTFTTTVKFAGNFFRGEEAKTKKVAEKNAAKVALMSVKSGSELPDFLNAPASIAKEMTVASPVPENPTLDAPTSMWHMACRNDIHMYDALFIAVYKSLIPAKEDLVKQRQLMAQLENLVGKEWPHAKLYLYGSCANSFGFRKSDIDVCLAIEDDDINKSEMLLKLAEILESDNLQNVLALTRARVPIVKLMDPVTGISCDICINNVLAVVNTKLLRDYARIDVRLRQLAFVVKHWAKSRRVNETYKGTLSSYAYVLMCIQFLQQRRPPILPCLQEMEPTYKVRVDNIRCAYFDNVDELVNFGSSNRETIAELVWGFFNYWAYAHDYANNVVSVRTGSILGKREKKGWNDRHLICIEDPFETSHDLGCVVNEFSIRVLREEFERAAKIMHQDPNPCTKLLFEHKNVPTLSK